MNMWSVALPADDPQTAALQRATLASLPARLTVADNGTADIRVVSGRASTWLRHAEDAITSGARALLISSPEPVPVDEARQLARRAADADVIVAVDSPYVCDPTFTSTLPDYMRTSPTRRSSTASSALHRRRPRTRSAAHCWPSSPSCDGFCPRSTSRPLQLRRPVTTCSPVPAATGWSPSPVSAPP